VRRTISLGNSEKKKEEKKKKKKKKEKLKPYRQKKIIYLGSG
jgi:hypothetical protein